MRPEPLLPPIDLDRPYRESADWQAKGELAREEARRDPAIRDFVSEIISDLLVVQQDYIDRVGSLLDTEVPEEGDNDLEMAIANLRDFLAGGE